MACDQNHVMQFNYTLEETNNFSIAFYIKLPASMHDSGQWHALMTMCTSDSTVTQISWTSYNNIKIYDTSNHQVCWLALEYDVWIHFTITNHFENDTNYISVYKNGSLVNTWGSSSELKLMSGTFRLANGVNPSTGPVYYNDLRIYNHALSIKEIKEISKGLVLHYALDGINETNVPYGYQELEYIESTGTSWINTQTTFNPEIDSCKVVFKANSTTQNGMIFANTGTNYFWFYYYNSGGKVNLYADNGSGQQYIPGIGLDTDKHIGEYNNKHLYIDGSDKGSLSKTYGEGTSIWLFTYGSGSYPFNGRIYYVDIVKNGVYKRIFIPAKRLSDNAVGMYDTVSRTFFESSNANFTAGPIIATPSTVFDDSGHNNDGIINGRIQIVDDHRRYDKCAYGNAYITNDNILVNAPMTVSYWVQFYITGTVGSADVIVRTGPFVLYKDHNGNDKYTIWIECNDRTYYCGVVYQAIENAWYHIAITNNGSATNVYVNNVKTTLDITAKEIYGISLMQNNNIKLSDFRIYKSVLSDEEIAKLYNMSASIDKENMWCYEYKETEDKVKINKNGIAYNSQIIEDSVNVSFNNSGVIKSNNFYEI